MIIIFISRKFKRRKKRFAEIIITYLNHQRHIRRFPITGSLIMCSFWREKTNTKYLLIYILCLFYKPYYQISRFRNVFFFFLLVFISYSMWTSSFEFVFIVWLDLLSSSSFSSKNKWNRKTKNIIGIFGFFVIILTVPFIVPFINLFVTPIHQLIRMLTK